MFWTLSFSGAGHLLPYHLGVATILSRSSSCLPYPIRAVAGSSSGAIAATAMTLLPLRCLEEYSYRFLNDRGYAIRHLQQMLMEEDLISAAAFSTSSSTATTDAEQQQRQPERPLLVICTTKCSTGKMHLLSFEVSTGQRPPTELILKAVKASCLIPRSFHPFDMFSRFDLSYANEEGILLDDGSFHVDGGIAAPIPSTPLDQDPNCQGRIQVSPISGPMSSLSIRPNDVSLQLLPFHLTTTRCQPFQIRPSLQNVRAMVVAMGITSSDTLRDWYRRGMDDATVFVERLGSTTNESNVR
jgi:predicted acylesterase/phospholipase RssA